MVTFEAAAALIGLREGLEALLVVGILLGILRRLGHPEKARLVWAGALAGVALSVALGLAIDAFVGPWFEDQGGAALFELVVALAAVAVLTWMVLWMHHHAKEMVGGFREVVAEAASSGRWVAVASLAFVTVLREGVETVLFFQALSAQATWGALLLGGLVGFGASAVLAYAIFRMTVEVDVRRFFAVTGLLLILVAAGLLVHVGHAAADLGLVPHTEPLWDTSATLPDEDHWLGGPLHALVGYEDQPTALQLLVYLTYVLGIGGWYLASLQRPARQGVARRTTAALLALVLLTFALAGAVGGPATTSSTDGHDHGHLAVLATPDVHAQLTARAAALPEDVRVGVLIRDHGEFVHYNASTYESVKQFVRDLWPYTGLPSALLDVDQGTYLLDEANPFATMPDPDAKLVDAWLSPWTLPAVPVSDPLDVDALPSVVDGQYYHIPGAGPGLGEGDLFEIIGLGTYRNWLKMDNHSPRHEQGMVSWAYLGAQLTKHFGDQVVVAFAHGVDPKVDPAHTIEAAAARLADAGVDVVLDAYQSSVRSDAMDTCMMAPHAEHALRAAGYDGPIVPVGMAGLQPQWAAATTAHVATKLAAIDADGPVAIHLTQHGARPGSPNPCGAGEDQYHANTQAQFELVGAALMAAFAEGTVTVRHVYAQGAEAQDDGVLSPREALELDADAGIEHVLIVPYEFWGDGVDVLVELRESLGLTPDEAPYYDADHETRLTVRGMDVLVTSGAFETDAKSEAQLAAIAAALATLDW